MSRDMKLLLLVWGGVVVREGCDRAVRCLWGSQGLAPEVIPFDYGAEKALCYARRCEAAGFCTVVEV